MGAFSKTLLGLMVLAAFWYKADAPLSAQPSVQKLDPLAQPTVNLPRSIDDNCSFMLPSGEPIFLCVTNRPLSSSTADTSIPQYEIKTYVYHLASPSSGVLWAAKPIESSWNQRNIEGKIIRQVTGDGKILIWQGVGNGGADGPVLLDDQGYQITVPGIFQLGKDQVYQPVDLTKIQDPEFISTKDGQYILAFSETKNSQKLWKVWGLGVVSERLGGGQLTIISEKILPLTGNNDHVTFFQTSDRHTIVAYAETVNNKLKIQVINFGRLLQAAAFRPIAVWQNTFEIPELNAKKLINGPLIKIQEDNAGGLLLSVAFNDSGSSLTYGSLRTYNWEDSHYTRQCFWSLNIRKASADWTECKNNPHSAFHLDSQGHLWLAYPEKDNQQSHASKIMVEVLEPFQTSTKKIIFHPSVIEISLPEGVAVNQGGLFSQGIIWVGAILPATNQGAKIALLLSVVHDNPAVEGARLSEMLLIVNRDGYIEKAFNLPWPSDKNYSSNTVFIPSLGFVDLKIEPDQKGMWVYGTYFFPVGYMLPQGNFRSQLFYVPLTD